MALHHDLLEQAQHLATREPKRPKQSSLRRAVSGAYYALFHLLVAEATSFLVSGSGRLALRHQLGRSFEHRQMKDAANAFANPKASSAWKALLAPASPSGPLRDVARTFVLLQQERHDADYDLGRTFSRTSVRALVAQTRLAFAQWHAVRGTSEAEAFLLALLIRGRS